MATIESKSVLTGQDLEKVNNASITHSKLSVGKSPGMTVGKIHERPYNY